MTGRLAGRRVLITGGSRGIGAATAQRAAAEGADVALTARTLEPGGHRLGGSLEETAAQIRDHGRRAVPLACDLSVPEERDGLVARAAEALEGPVDVLINNAAAAIYQPLLDYPRRRRRLTFEVNVEAPLDLTQQALPSMLDRGEGWIVNLSSATARLADGPPFELVQPGTDMAVYGASKAALNRLTNGVAAATHERGIRVNTVEPKAAVLSEGAALLVGDTLREDQIESMEEMVEAVLALCDAPPTLTGRVCVSLDLLAELGVEARRLDGAPR